MLDGGAAAEGEWDKCLIDKNEVGRGRRLGGVLTAGREDGFQHVTPRDEMGHVVLSGHQECRDWGMTRTMD